ncbi:hypothetical protein ACWDX8_27725 [Streptomyces anthocyanicus]|uniref:hypothetical protein n=1 Tax=Streptomyces violaceoruber group TaxID=2867121 RepID=UPI002242D710|nr:hypothetical protein [Streptomyces anthocyanicus]MCW8121601.1 hypothetical protein [Streptomyces anthocyanicus]
MICSALQREVGRQARTTAVLAAAVPVRAGQVAFPCPGGDALCVGLVDRRLAAMQAAGAEG